MARISEYEAPQSAKSTDIINRMLKNATITHDDIELFQQKYGISTQEFARLSGHNEAQISQWRNQRRDIPPRVQQHFKLLFAEFKNQFDK